MRKLLLLLGCEIVNDLGEKSWHYCLLCVNAEKVSCTDNVSGEGWLLSTSCTVKILKLVSKMDINVSIMICSSCPEILF